MTVLLVHSAIGQITITASDVASALAPGNPLTGRTDTSAKTANIGTLGSTSWDFSTLTPYITSGVMSVRADTTPYIGWFPGATNCFHVASFGGALYEYFELGTNFLLRGSVLSGAFLSRSSDTPGEILYQLPMTFGTMWTATFAESTTVTLPFPLPPEVTVTNYVVENSVDAYGTLTLPGGGSFQALRIRSDRRSTSGLHSNRTISYSMLAANGASATVAAADTLQPNTGVINAGSVSWSNPLVTSVRSNDDLPGGFALMQNYPNPFNPETMIRYRVQTSGVVTLKVYDVLGRTIATLVNEVKQPGQYSVRWNGGAVPSGVYMYRLSSGRFSGAKTMVLMK